MVDEEIGQAEIAYENPDGEVVEREVDNEHIAYFQDHWIVKTDGDLDVDGGHDTVRRIPLQRVYYVERSVDEFEEEVRTLRNQIQSFADDLRSKVMGGGGGGDSSDASAHRIDVGGDSSDERRDS